MIALACLTLLAGIVLLTRRNCMHAAFAALVASLICASATAAEQSPLSAISFEAMQSRGLSSTLCVATSPSNETLDFTACAQRQPVGQESVTFMAMAQRSTKRQAAVASKQPQPAPSPKPSPVVTNTPQAPTGMSYQHLNGQWHSTPQPGVQYFTQSASPLLNRKPQMRCVNGQCYIQ